jgi:hypothetical protein
MCQALNGSGSSDLLFLALDRLYPDMVGRMGADVCDKVTDVRRVWERCVVEHPPYCERWLRPPFSKSEPYTGNFHRGLAGGIQKREHKIQDFNLLTV